MEDIFIILVNGEPCCRGGGSRDIRTYKTIDGARKMGKEAKRPHNKVQIATMKPFVIEEITGETD